ncbi:MAG: sigma factor, partial [Woeseiaceae bacterium]
MIKPVAHTADAEDHHLVARVVTSSDTDAFGELIRRHQSHIRNFLRRLTSDPVAADDLAQDCFMHAWAKL